MQDQLAQLARRQDALFTIAQARGCDVSDRMVQTMLRNGIIERVHPGVYRYCMVPWTWEARLRAAVLATGDRGCASHGAAAHLLGLGGIARGLPEVCVPWSALPALTGVALHRSRDLPDRDRTLVRGIPSTTGTRTLIDLASRLPWAVLIALVDEAICARVAHRKTLYRRAEELQCGRAGVGTIMRVTRPGAEGEFWSVLERTFGTGVSTAALPMPRFNAPLRYNGRLYITDALWDVHRLIVELHGLRFHRTPAQRGSDDERLNVFTLMQFRTLVFTWRDVHERFDHVLATLAAALRVGPLVDRGGH